MKQTKRILSIKLKRENDLDPDTSYLGEYSNNPTGEFSISRIHDLDCPTQTDQDAECNCDCAGSYQRGQGEYFNPASVEPFKPEAHWIPSGVKMVNRRDYWEKAMRENARKDYERMEAYNRGDWEYIGVRAYANVVVDGVNQSIASGGLWGIESDSEASYLRSVEQEQLRELRGILHELGFSTRAIAAAVKAICAGPSTDSLRSHAPDCAQRIGGECTCGVFQHNQTIYESED